MKRMNFPNRKENRRLEAKGREFERADMTEAQRAEKDRKTLMKHGNRQQIEFARR